MRIDVEINSDERIRLSGIHCRIIYDIGALSENQSFRGTETMRRGVQYGKPTEEQKEKLEVLLQQDQELCPGSARCE